MNGMGPLGEREREIADIRQLDSVHFYDLLDIRAGPGNRRAMGALVFYGDSRILNYSQADPEFDLLLQKLLYQYPLEKGERPIAADAFSRRLLETGAVDLPTTLARHYCGQHSVAHSLLPFARQAFLPVEGVVKYLLEQFFTLQGTAANAVGFTGYRERIALRMAVEGEGVRILPLRVTDCGPFRYAVSAGNLGRGINGVRLHIEFGDGSIRAGWQTPDGSLQLLADYRLGGAGLHIEERLLSGGTLHSCRTELLREAVSGSQAAAARALWRMDMDIPAGDVFRLPWGGLLLRSRREEPVDGRYTQTLSDTAYLMPGGDSAVVLYRGEKGLRATGGPFYLKTDAAMKTTTVCRVGQYGVAQTRFAHAAHALGQYKREMAGRCYYSLFQAPDRLDALTRITLRPVRRQDGVEAGYQLLDADTLHRIWEGDGADGEHTALSQA